MSSSDHTIIVDADTSPAQKKLTDIEAEAARVNAAIATNIRRTAEITLFFAQATGIVIDQVLQLMIETGLRTIEFVTRAIALETAGTLGLNWATGRVALQGLAVGLMIIQINALTRAKSAAAQKIGYATSALRAMTF